MGADGPLTAADVRNAQFRIAFRGYALDEVDVLLDRVQQQLVRLEEENEALRRQLREAGLEPEQSYERRPWER